MKKKKIGDKVVSYGFSNPEMHKALRSHKHTVIEDKKKRNRKYACRAQRSAGSFCTYEKKTDRSLFQLPPVFSGR